MSARGLPANGLAVRVAAEKDAAPARLSRFRVLINAPEAAGPRDQTGLLRAASHYPIHNTFLNHSQIEVLLDEFTDLSEPSDAMIAAVLAPMPSSGAGSELR